MVAKRSDPWMSAALLVVSVAALGRALQVGDGILQPGAMAWLTASLLLCAAGVLVPWPPAGKHGPTVVRTCLAVCLAWAVWQLLERAPFYSDLVNASGARFFQILVGLAGLLTAVLFVPRAASIAFPLLLIVQVAMGIWAIRHSQSTGIDVIVFQRDACNALLAGQNPYSLTYPDIYGDGSPWYGNGVSVGGRLQFGYPYMPVTLLLTLPGQLIGNDYRYALAIAATLAAALIGYARATPLSFAAAALLMLQPRGLYILERGWCEPTVVLLVAATVFCAARLPRILPIVFGLLLVSKQYLPAAVLLAPLLLRRNDRRELASMLIKTGIAALVVTLPLVLWNWSDFWHSAVGLQLRQPYRWDSLSFLAWIGRGERVAPLPWWVAFVTLLTVMILALWRCRRTPAGFASAVALSYFCFFAFNKQAFGNYYYFVIGAVCTAIATSAAED